MHKNLCVTDPQLCVIGSTAYAFISSSSRFRPSLTGLAVCGGEVCRATAEITQKIIGCVGVQSLMALSSQVDLVLE